MKCKIDGCSNTVMYKKDNVCQKHYFRKMRYGTYELTSVRKYRIQNPAGYQKLYEPLHPLCNKDGYVYEHRKVYFDSGKQFNNCSICNIEINWNTLHIDHIDKDVTNNNLNNLRPTCRNCNTFRDLTTDVFNKKKINCKGLSLTASQWARRDEVEVSANTIIFRLSKGLSSEDAIFGKRKTHQNTKTKKVTLAYYKD